MREILFGNYHFNRHSAESFLGILSELGIRAAELCPYASWLDITDREDCVRFRTMMDAAGVRVGLLVIEQGGVVPFNLGLEQPDVERWSLEYGRKVIANMAALGADRLLVSAGRQSADLPREEGWERSARNLETLAKAAASEGVSLLLCCDGEKESANIICNTADQLKMLERLAPCGVQGYYDTAACLAAGDDPLKAAAALQAAGRLDHVCLADGPDGWQLPGDGTLGEAGIAAILKSVREQGYEGPVTWRLRHWKYDFTPVEYTKQLKDILDRIA